MGTTTAQRTAGGLCLLLALISLATPTHAQTLATVKKRGHLKCGVSQGLPGFSFMDKNGQWQGLDAAFCHALAAATLGDATKVKFVALSAKERFTALQSGEIDILSRNTTWTMQRDATLGIDFAGTIYYDGQGFLVPKKIGVNSAKELNGATICVNTGTTTELNVADYFRAHGMTYKLLAYEKDDEVVAAYDTGRCDVYTTDQSGLYANRLKLKKPDDHKILPEIISKEPLSPATRHGDQHWTDIVRWTLTSLTTAEELGITAQNAKSMLASKNPEIQRLLGVGKAAVTFPGLANDWAYKVITSVGNYGELFTKHLGSQSPLNIDRGQNKLWRDGGLHYPLPFR